MTGSGKNILQRKKQIKNLKLKIKNRISFDEEEKMKCLQDDKMCIIAVCNQFKTDQ